VRSESLDQLDAAGLLAVPRAGAEEYRPRHQGSLDMIADGLLRGDRQA
jgi:hypothetical protein